MISTPAAIRLLENLLDADGLRAATQSSVLADIESGARYFSDLDKQDVATLMRIASGEAYEDPQLNTPLNKKDPTS